MEFPSQANGPAYEKHESRHGIPLDYVTTKLESAITDLHSFGRAHPELREDLQGVMHYQLVALLALNNMLAAANAPQLAARMLAGTREELEHWINFVQREGDVAGVAPPGKGENE